MGIIIKKKVVPLYIPELRLTVYRSVAQKIADVRKKYLDSAEYKKVTIGSNLRHGLSRYKP